jgi:hypothetical protein
MKGLDQDSRTGDAVNIEVSVDRYQLARLPRQEQAINGATHAQEKIGVMPRKAIGAKISLEVTGPNTAILDHLSQQWRQRSRGPI